MTYLVNGTFYTLLQMEYFVDSYPDLGSGTRAFYQAIEKTKSNTKWMQKNFGIIKSWLIGNGH